MSGECEKCSEHSLECNCKPWKPNRNVYCPECEDILFISSIIPMNGQVNFACANKECYISGFLLQGSLYCNYETD